MQKSLIFHRKSGFLPSCEIGWVVVGHYQLISADIVFFLHHFGVCN
jgi:hypothetical protein